MLGLILARAGVSVLVLEKHGDFLRDFRGDTIHPSTLEVLAELGILDDFLRRPHQKINFFDMQYGKERFRLADLTRLPTRCKFIALMPQWHFLDFLASHGRSFATFDLRMRAEAAALIYDDARVAGIRAHTPDGELEIRTDLVVAADGRHSTLRKAAGLRVLEVGAPMDVLWMRMSRRANDPGNTIGRFDAGQILIMIDRDDYWQCAFVIPKGGFDAVRGRGLEEFRARIVRIAPEMADRVGEIASWNDVSLLTVAVDRLSRWHRAGLLCIGDAAHALSPVGGVGINLAIQDAVAAANILVPAFRTGAVTENALHAVQSRRELAVRATQAVQVFVQNRLITSVLGDSQIGAPPLPLRLTARYPLLQRALGRLLAIGVRPEHVAVAAANS